MGMRSLFKAMECEMISDDAIELFANEFSSEVNFPRRRQLIALCAQAKNAGELERENARLREELATREALYKEQWQRAEQAEACALAAEKDAERYQGVANEWADGHLSHAVLDEVTDLDAAVDAARGELAAMGAKHEAT